MVLGAMCGFPYRQGCRGGLPWADLCGQLSNCVVYGGGGPYSAGTPSHDWLSSLPQARSRQINAEGLGYSEPTPECWRRELTIRPVPELRPAIDDRAKGLGLTKMAVSGNL